MNLSPGISVCFIIKNGIINGYPFWESLQSCLPIADEIVISEGFSRDLTYKAIEKFRKDNGGKVKVVRHDWGKFVSSQGEVISRVSTATIEQCTKQWVYYLQADEIIHPDNYQVIRDMASGKLGNYNSINFRFAHFIGSWEPLPVGSAAYSYAIRMIRNIPEIHLIGDAWTFGGGISPSYPHEKIPKPVYHLGWVFPKNINQKNIEQAKIYSGMKIYQDKARDAQSRIDLNSNKVGLPPPKDFSDFPEGIKRLIGQYEYTLPPGVI